jgi:hypothetical protein
MAIVCAYNGTTFTFPNLLGHPYGFEESEVRRGRAAEQLKPSGLLLPTEANTLAGLYRAWNAARLPQGDPLRTGSLGAVVTVSGKAPGFDWTTPRSCWFTSAPTFEQRGAFVAVAFTVVDAAQALAIQLREAEEEAERADDLSLGTITLGSATITLTAPARSYNDLPQLSLSPAGVHVITGPLAVTEVREIEGWVTPQGLTDLEGWLVSATATSPAVNAWFPTAWGKPTARLTADGGSVVTRYDVSLTVAKIR